MNDNYKVIADLENRLQTTSVLTAQDIASLGIAKPSTLELWRKQGDGPPCFHVGRSYKYPTDGVIKWLKSSLITNEKSKEKEPRE